MQRFYKVTCLCCIFESTSANFVSRALRNFAMPDFEKNVEEMVGTTREAAGATESAGDETGTRPAVLGTRPATRQRQDGGDGW